MTWFRDSRTVAAYFAVDGEIDLGPLIDRALGLGKQVCLPVVEQNGTLRFATLTSDVALEPNQYGVPEPPHRGFVDCRELDLVLAPLVAFDARGHRIGMGAGFYDRTFAFLNARPRAARPILVGAAYELQRAANFDADPWDVPLDGVVTDRSFYDLRDEKHATSSRDE